MDLGDHLLTDHVSHSLMDHANRWLMVMSHYQSRSLTRCLSRFASSCQIR